MIVNAPSNSSKPSASVVILFSEFEQKNAAKQALEERLFKDYIIGVVSNGDLNRAHGGIGTDV